MRIRRLGPLAMGLGGVAVMTSGMHLAGVTMPPPSRADWSPPMGGMVGAPFRKSKRRILNASTLKALAPPAVASVDYFDDLTTQAIGTSPIAIH